MRIVGVHTFLFVSPLQFGKKEIFARARWHSEETRWRWRVLEYPLISQTHTEPASASFAHSLARFETNKQQLGSTLWLGYKKTQKHLRWCRAKLLYAEGTLVECE